MDARQEKLGTYKEFGKMLREIADIYSKLGDIPLAEEGMEREDVVSSISFITHKHAFEDYICPLKDQFVRIPLDVTAAIKWRDYVLECYRTGKQVEYPNHTNEQ